MAKSDIEIAREAKLRPIEEIAERAGIPDEAPLPLRAVEGQGRRGLALGSPRAR